MHTSINHSPSPISRPSQLLSRTAILFLACLALPPLQNLRADERLFTYSYEADVLPQGRWEFEQWITHRRGHSGETFSAWDFREEIEYGLLENLSASLYLNFRQKKVEDDSEFEFEGISSEWRWRVMNPNTQPVGLTLYVEPTYNGTEAELEEKIILSKNFGESWVAAFNATTEQEWEREGGHTEEETKLEFTAGVAYRLDPHWSIGLEARNRHVFEGLRFSDREGSAWFVGPNVHYGSAGWWATLTVLPQVHGSPQTSGGLELHEHEKIEVRLIVGKNF